MQRIRGLDGFHAEYEALRREEAEIQPNIEAIDVELEQLQRMTREREASRKDLRDRKGSLQARMTNLIQSFNSRSASTAGGNGTALSASAASGLEDELSSAIRRQSSLSSLLTPSTQTASTGPSTGDDHVQRTYKPTQNATSAAPTKQPKEYEILSQKFPVIVCIDGRPVIISCFVGNCRANASNRGFFKGFHGLKIHITRAHPEVKKKYSTERLAEKCEKNFLNDSDATLVLSGREPQASIGLVCSILAQGQEETQAINGVHLHVVKVNGVWMELSCKKCGANYSHFSGRFFNGAFAVAMHFRLAHKADNIAMRDAEPIDYCNLRRISDADVSLLAAKPPQEPLDVKILKKATNKAIDANGDSDSDSGSHGSEISSDDDVKVNIGTKRCRPGPSPTRNSSSRTSSAPFNTLVQGTAPNRSFDQLHRPNQSLRRSFRADDSDEFIPGEKVPRL